MASHTMVVSPIMSALVKTEEILGANRKWKSINIWQKIFIRDFFIQREELIRFKPEELRNWISNNAEELNAILKKEGFDIQLEKFPPNEFGVVSILDVMVEWLMKATESEIQIQGNRYSAISMKNIENVENESIKNFDVMKCQNHKHPVFCLHTKSGDKVFMTVAKEEVKDFQLIIAIDDIRDSEFIFGHFDRLIFPMVDYEDMVDISWLQGLNTIDQKNLPWNISQAMQQTKFKMNCQGARVKSAVAIAVRMCASVMPNIYTIDKPFLLWIEREGLDIPIMYAYLDKDTWKNPGSLEM